MDEFDISLLISNLEYELLGKMKKHLMKYMNNTTFQSKKEWNRWQVEQLAALEKFKNENKNIFKEDIKDIKKEVEKFLNDNYNNGIKEEEKRILEAISKGAKLEKLNKNFYGINSNRFMAILKEGEKFCDNIEVAILRSTNDIYRRVIRECATIKATGVPVWECVDKAVEEFTNNGITMVQYKDGRNINIASYSEMAMRTAGKRSTTQGQADARRTFGDHLVIVSHYNGCSQLCWDVQGKVFFDDVYTDYNEEDLKGNKYPLLSNAINGTLGRLFHPNCRHSISTYYPGITQKRDVMIDKDENDTRYKLEQKQRYYERKIRDAKKSRELALTDEYRKKLDLKVKTLQAKQRELVNNNDFLRRDYAREKVRV